MKKNEQEDAVKVCATCVNFINCMLKDNVNENPTICSVHRDEDEPSITQMTFEFAFKGVSFIADTAYDSNFPGVEAITFSDEACNFPARSFAVASLFDDYDKVLKWLTSVAEKSNAAKLATEAAAVLCED